MMDRLVGGLNSQPFKVSEENVPVPERNYY